MIALSLFPQSDKARTLGGRIGNFLRDRIEPAEAGYFTHIGRPGQRWTIPPVIERLKAQARADGLWNLFLPTGPSRPSMASGALGLLPGATKDRGERHRNYLMVLAEQDTKTS